MEHYTIYHNPRCRKSREALQFLKDAGLEGEEVRYLETPFTKEQLQKILNQIELLPSAVLRKNESEWKSIPNRTSLDEDQILDCLIKFPKLIESPIVLIGNKGILARPLENLALFLKRD